MFRSNNAKTIIAKTLETKVSQNNYASAGGKSKFPEEYLASFSEKEKKNVINNHVQYITDFNIIYADPKDIRIYQIAHLYTKPRDSSYIVSEKQNYHFESQSQNIEFFKEPVLIRDRIHVVRTSKKYFEQSEIQQAVEDKSEFKAFQDKVLAQLKKDNIAYRLANGPEDLQLTGLKILEAEGEKTDISDPTSYMQTLNITNDEKQ